MPNNSLIGVESNWVSDGSNGRLSVALPELSVASDRGKPCNVLLDAPVQSNNFYFEVEIARLKGSVSVGVAKKNEFFPGYKTKGMFYNGNVTNASAALIVGFGEYVKEGSKIGVALCHEPSGILSTTFYLNGCCLGTAFRIEGVQSNEIFLPCIHVNGEATAVYSVPPDLPHTTERQSEQQSDAYLGDWKLKQLMTGPELHEFPLPSNHDIILTFRQTSNDKTYDFSAKVANSLATRIQIVGKAEAFDTIKVGLARSTMMMPPPDLQPVEKLVADSLPKLSKMIVGEDLVMTGPDVEFIAGRFSKTFDPLAKY